jgi:hypothetical protein
MILGLALALSLEWSKPVAKAPNLCCAADHMARYSTARQRRPLSALEDEEPTVEWSPIESV